MRTPQLSPEISRHCLSAYVAILTEGGHQPLSSEHTRTLEALARHIFPYEGAVDAIEPAVEPGLKSAFADPDLARLASLVFCLAPVTVEIPRRGVVASLERVLAQTGLDTLPGLPIAGLHHLVEHRRERARLRLTGGMVRELYGHRTMVTAVAALISFGNGLLPADRRGTRCEDLLARPPGTFGHALGRYYRDNDFDFPGDRGVKARMTVPHDARHVLFGWDTTIDGEMGIAPCEAGASPEPLYAYLIASLAVANTGFDIAPDSPPFLSRVDMDGFLAELTRGMRADSTLMGEVDFLTHIDEPLDAVRARYGIAPGGNVAPGGPWCGSAGPKPYADLRLHRTAVLPQTGDGLVAVSLTGRLSAADLVTIDGLIDAAAEAHGQVDIVLRLQRFAGWSDMRSLIATVRWWLRPTARIRRVAILGEQRWMRALLRVDGLVSRPTIRVFHIEDEPEAVRFCRFGAS